MPVPPHATSDTLRVSSSGGPVVPWSSSALWRLGLPLALFSVLWLDLIRLLSGNWEAREQYAYGWFVPFLALALFWKRWMDRPEGTKAESRKQKTETGPAKINFYSLLSIFLLCLLLLPLRVIFEINTDWPLIAWAYTSIVVGLTLYAFHLAGPSPLRLDRGEGQGEVSSCSSGPSSSAPGVVVPASQSPSVPESLSPCVRSPSLLSPWVRHFAFPVAFILVALVWPYRIEKGLTQNLMQWVASLTVEIIGWFGIPAFQRGNLIEVATGVVGVDEACSGIRSFQSTLMAGLFLGELYRLKWPRRISLVLIGLILAFGFNVVRTLILTWQASSHGIAAIDKWHDPAGMIIFLISFACLWALAGWLRHRAQKGEDRRSKIEDRQPAALSPNSQLPTSPPASHLRPPASEEVRGSRFEVQSSGLDSPSEPPVTPSSNFRLLSPTPQGFLLSLGLWSILCLLATEVWYRSHDRPDSGFFRWTVAMPQNNTTYQKIELPPRTLKLLSFDEGASGKWTEDSVEWSTHFFRWKPRSVQAVITSRIHRPEVCLTASGLRQVSESELVWLDAPPLKIPFRKYVFEAEGRRLYVFFCQLESGTERQTGLAGSKQAGRLQVVLKGQRLVGQQTLEIILTGCDSLDQAEQELQRRLPQLIEPATPGKQLSQAQDRAL
jgi:exosortase/archaeosortase family protein